MMRPHDPLSRYQYQLSRSPPKNRTADKITDFDNDSKGMSALTLVESNKFMFRGQRF